MTSTTAPTMPGMAATVELVFRTVMAATLVTSGLPGRVRVKV